MSGAGARLIAITDLCDRPPGVRTRRQVVSCTCSEILAPFNALLLNHYVMLLCGLILDNDF